MPVDPSPPPADPVDSAELSDMLDSLVASGTDAVDSLASHEDAPPPKDNTDVCADLRELEGKLESMLAAVKATQADLGCTVI
jgi:hypothetical protein